MPGPAQIHPSRRPPIQKPSLEWMFYLTLVETTVCDLPSCHGEMRRSILHAYTKLFVGKQDHEMGSFVIRYASGVVSSLDHPGMGPTVPGFLLRGRLSHP